MKHRIYKPYPRHESEWVFDCIHCGGLSWYATQAEATTFGCELQSCAGRGVPHTPSCPWCGNHEQNCICSTQGFPIIYER